MSLAKELLKDAFSRGILSLEGSFSATLPFIEKTMKLYVHIITFFPQMSSMIFAFFNPLCAFLLRIIHGGL